MVQFHLAMQTVYLEQCCIHTFDCKSSLIKNCTCALLFSTELLLILWKIAALRYYQEHRSNLVKYFTFMQEGPHRKYQQILGRVFFLQSSRNNLTIRLTCGLIQNRCINTIIELMCGCQLLAYQKFNFEDFELGTVYISLYVSVNISI